MGILDLARAKVRQQLLEKVDPHVWASERGGCAACKAELSGPEDVRAHQLEVAYLYGRSQG